MTAKEQGLPEAVAWLCVSPDGFQRDATTSAHARDTYARAGRIITPLAALRAQPAGGGGLDWRERYHDRCRVISEWHQRAVALGYEGVHDLLTLALPCIVNNAGEERALTRPQPVEGGGPCGCLNFCEHHGREFIEVAPDAEEYCHECSADDGSGELCTPMAGSCDMLSQRSNEFQRSFMCPAHAAENVKFCEDSYAERTTPPESGGQGAVEVLRRALLDRSRRCCCVDASESPSQSEVESAIAALSSQAEIYVFAIAQGGGNER